MRLEADVLLYTGRWVWTTDMLSCQYM